MSYRACLAFVLLSIGLFHSSVRRQSTPEKPVPRDACVLELILPAGATVNVDGRDTGAGAN